MHDVGNETNRNAVYIDMRGTWVLGLLALATTLVLGARWAGYPVQQEKKPEVVQKPVVKIDPVRGFSEQEKQVVTVLHNFIVTALDDLEPTRGTQQTRLNPDGTYTKYIGEAEFGMSRVDSPYVFEHDDMRFVGLPLRQLEVVDTPVGKKYVDIPYVPHLVVSAGGRPLTEEKLSVVWTGNSGSLAGQDEVLAAIRKNLAAGLLGADFGFEIDGFEGWAKPLKLTKQECLSCHPGMSVGDTVAIAAYLSPKK